MNKLGPYELNQIYTGDARELAKSIPDNSVDLIFTDPIYERIEDYEWLAEIALRILKPDKACLVWIATGQLNKVLKVMTKYLDYVWQFIEFRANEVKYKPAPNGRCLYASCLWLNKGYFRPKPVFDIRTVNLNSSPNSAHHIWHKIPITLQYYLNAFTQNGDIVFDPFTGSGTIPAVAKILGVNYWASEINLEIAEVAKKRVEQTQPPLFVVQPEQMVFT